MLILKSVVNFKGLITALRPISKSKFKILMLLTRPYLVKKLSRKKVSTNLDRVIGMEGIVTEEITKFKIGEVKVDGKKWSAISNEKIKVGEEVIIEDIDGVKLIVRKEEEK